MRFSTAVLVTVATLLAVAPASAQPKWERDRAALERACGAGEAAACTAFGHQLLRGDKGPSGVREPQPATAVAPFERACEIGNDAGCAALASLYAAGEAVAKATSRALQLYTQACDAGYASACLELGDLIASGTDAIPANPARAGDLHARGVALLTAACDRGEAEPCVTLGSFHDRGGYGVPKDPARALERYLRACERESRSGCTAAAYAVGTERPGAPRDATRARELSARAAALELAACQAGDVWACSSIGTPLALNTGCEAGDPDACFQLGHQYIPYLADKPGDGEKAAHFFLKGCEQGSPSLCTEAGDLHAGVYPRTGTQLLRADLPRAAALYRRACDGGDSEGCLKLAGLTATGAGVASDAEGAAALLDRSCTSDDPRGCVPLGRQLVAGTGGPADPAGAAAAFERACLAKYPEGCYELALLRRAGTGVTRDEARARTELAAVCAENGSWSSGWTLGCREACELGAGRACEALGRAADRGSPEPSLPPDAAQGFYERAVGLFEAACQAEDAVACYDLGKLHASPKPLREDVLLAHRSFERGCSLGSARACVELAQQYFWGTHGKSVGINRTRALAFYSKGCELDEADGCERAAEMLLREDGDVTLDRARAAALRERAQAIKKRRGY